MTTTVDPNHGPAMPDPAIASGANKWLYASARPRIPRGRQPVSDHSTADTIGVATTSTRPATIVKNGASPDTGAWAADGRLMTRDAQPQRTPRCRSTTPSGS
ncbi:MAG: hypothetical protein KBF94_14625, partial [Ilumatobacteraceae bacterium]|nr:hypothetical protein [Ilumatobacteraceae bacterium]